jgi:WD40 repeat protein
VWETSSGKELTTLIGHSSIVNSAVFSPDGSKILTASDDKTAKVWDTVSGKELTTLIGHSDRVSSAVFNPDGSKILTASSDKTAKLYLVRLEDLVDLANTRVTRALTKEERQQFGVD